MTAKSPVALLQTIGSALFFQPSDENLSAIQTLLNNGLIQPIQQGKLSRYALTLAGYIRWNGHQQRDF